MNPKNGYKYLIESYEDDERLGKAVLMLTTMKSSKDTIIEIYTHEGTNLIEIVTGMSCDTFIKQYIGNIKFREELKILELNNDDLDQSVNKRMVHMNITNMDYYPVWNNIKNT